MRPGWVEHAPRPVERTSEAWPSCLPCRLGSAAGPQPAQDCRLTCCLPSPPPLRTLAVDLLNPSHETEQSKHKLKRLVQSPNSFFMVSLLSQPST